MSNKYKEDLIEALNRMDEKVEEMGEDFEDRKQQAEDYDILFNYINDNL